MGGSGATHKVLSIFVTEHELRDVYLSMDEPLQVGLQVSTTSPHLRSVQRIACQLEDRFCSKLMVEKLLAEFGSPQKIFTASAEDLQRVNGIGKKLARKILDVVSTEVDESD